jgi:hypothetical protein
LYMRDDMPLAKRRCCFPSAHKSASFQDDHVQSSMNACFIT